MIVHGLFPATGPTRRIVRFKPNIHRAGPSNPDNFCMEASAPAQAAKTPAHPCLFSFNPAHLRPICFCAVHMCRTSPQRARRATRCARSGPVEPAHRLTQLPPTWTAVGPPVSYFSCSAPYNYTCDQGLRCWLAAWHPAASIPPTPVTLSPQASILRWQQMAPPPQV